MSLKKLEINNNNLVNNRENTHLEFKKKFHANIKMYVKSICAFANSKGGEFIFGVEDRPRKPIGINTDFKSFDEFDPKQLTTQIQNCLSNNIIFKFDNFTQEINQENITFGVLRIEEAENKPVICKISDQKNGLREGAIYYRYSGKSEEIKAQDLITLIQEEKTKEANKWMQHIQKIATIGVSNVGVFSYDGEIFAGDHKIIIDKEAVKQIKFIKEGSFVEKEGADALVLKGEIQGMESLEVVEISTDPNKTHPFEGIRSVEKEIQNNQKISFVEKQVSDNKTQKFCIEFQNGKIFTLSYLLQVLIKKHDISSKNNPDLMWENTKGTAKHYSQNFIDKMISYINNKEELNKIFI